MQIRSLTQKDIRELFAKAQRIVRQKEIDVLLAPRKLCPGHLLIITPRKTGSAHERNKVRRRLRAVFYEEKLCEAPYDCIVIVKQGGVEMAFHKLREVLLSAYQQALRGLHA
jgi:ribonuclease P protein component